MNSNENLASNSAEKVESLKVLKDFEADYNALFAQALGLANSCGNCSGCGNSGGGR